MKIFKKYGCVYKRNNKIVNYNILILVYYFFLAIMSIFFFKLFLKIVKLVNKNDTKYCLIWNSFFL